MKPNQPPNKPIKFIKCNEFEQTFTFSRSNRKSSYLDKSIQKKKES